MLFVICCWLFVVGYLLLVILVIICYWLFVECDFLGVICYYFELLPIVCVCQ